MDKKVFGLLVKQARVEKGFTQQELADKLKISKGSIYSVEAGKQYFSFENFNALCYILEKDPKYFLEFPNDYKLNNMNEKQRNLFDSILSMDDDAFKLYLDIFNVVQKHSKRL